MYYMQSVVKYEANGSGYESARKVGTQVLPGNDLSTLVNGPTRVREDGDRLEEGIDACGCPCPCPCITDIEGTIIKGAVFSSPFIVTSVL